MFNTNVHPAAANQRTVCLLLDARDCSGGFVTGIGMALARQRDSGRRRFLADFDCQCGQASSFADPGPFRGQLQTNAHTSIVKAIYSPKVMLFSAKLSGLDRKPRVHVTRPCGTALLSEGNAKKDRRFHWGAIKSGRTRCYRRTESAHRFSLCWQINGAETSRNPSSRYGRL